MNPETKLRVAELDDLTIGQLASKYETLFGEQCRSRNRRYLHRRVAWKLQADDEGGLSQRAILRAGVIADESLIRVTPPKGRSRHQDREPLVPENMGQAAARMAIFDFIEGFYNPHRRHSGLGNLSPVNYEMRYNQQVA